ncbi:FUSC family protein [Blastococcus deserti]|uniref:Aromatic acid exporter family protein n=1 Tax=Blastococcus deserti TaxID=2259033 RepID=A0ABW4XIV7_9ACTN
MAVEPACSSGPWHVGHAAVGPRRQRSSGRPDPQDAPGHVRGPAGSGGSDPDTGPDIRNGTALSRLGRTRRRRARPPARPPARGRAWALLRRPAIQRGVRASIAAGLAWQVAVLLPPLLSDYAYYAPLGAVIAVHPTVADSAGAAWRAVLAIMLGFGLAVLVYEATPSLPGSLTIALLVALAIGVERWGLLGQQAGWVSFAAVLMLTVGAEDPGAYVLRYAGLTLLGAAVGVIVTTVLFPPLQLTQAVEQIARTRDMLARHLEHMAARLARDEVPSPAEERRWMATLGPELDRMRRAEALVQRARQANPRARRWQEAAARIRAESRALDRVAVLIDDLTALVSELQPHRRGDETDVGTAQLLSAALTALAGVLRTPYHSADGTAPDPRTERINAAMDVLTRLVQRLGSLSGDRSLLPLSAVVVGVQRGLMALEAYEPDRPASTRRHR